LHLVYFLSGATATAAELSERLVERVVPFELRALQPVVPVTVPMWKDVGVPDLFDAILVIVRAMEGLFLFAEVFTLLDE